jgi:hypothetical protein
MIRADFLKRLVTIGGMGFMSVSAVEQKHKVYLLQTFVAGFRYYKGMELLSELEIGDWIELRRERDNQFDKSAIALYWQQEKIGFLPSTTNQMLAQLLDANALPLLAGITNLNRAVKPWENVEIAVYFFQEENKLNPHADYLLKLKEPRYFTKAKPKKEYRLKTFLKPEIE